jgi:hypothetical protein
LLAAALNNGVLHTFAPSWTGGHAVEARAPGEWIHADAPETLPGAKRQDYTSLGVGVNGGEKTDAVRHTRVLLAGYRVGL